MRAAVEKADADSELTIGLAPALDPIVDREKMEVSPGKIWSEFSQHAFLNRMNSILRHPKRHTDVANTARAARRGAPCRKCVPEACEQVLRVKAV